MTTTAIASERKAYVCYRVKALCEKGRMEESDETPMLASVCCEAEHM